MPTPSQRLLRQSPFLAQLDASRAAAFLEHAESRRFRRREPLFREGEPVEGLYLLAEGRVKLTQVTAGGSEVIMRLLAPGDVFAGIAALPGPDRYPVNAVALTAGEAAFWPRALARRLVHGESPPDAEPGSPGP